MNPSQNNGPIPDALCLFNSLGRFPVLRSRYALLLLVASLFAQPSLAELKPSEIAMVVARSNKESMGLARYYCRQRGVPVSQIIEIDVPAKEEIDRETWRWAIRPEIREWLQKNDPERKLRCLVTTWGVPLKIAKAKAKDDKQLQAYRDHIAREMAARYKQLDQIAKLLDGLAGGAPLGDALASMPETDGKQKPGDRLKKTTQRLETALKSAQARIAQLPTDTRKPNEARLQQLATAAGGTRVLLQGLGQQVQARQAAGEEVPLPLLERLNVLRGRASAFTELRVLLEARAPGIQTDDLVLRLLEQIGGQLACLDWLNKRSKVARLNESGASFDSELSLVLWSDGYELLRWQPNYLRGNYASSQLRKTFPTLMVSRLDGPNLPTAKRLIDDAIATEKAGGLKGKVYLDARGLAKREGPPLEPGSYPDYDRTLLITADGLKKLENAEGEPRFEVTLNEQPELFMPGQCPDAGLYCGWYSLGKYIDAFDWNRGAVAYHLASGEAATLKEIDSQVWCKKLLEDGVCATIGPVYEPYLLAFPRPNEFFALLIQSDLTLVEVYYQTKSFNSWAMTLIGDPLYRPFGRLN